MFRITFVLSVFCLFTGFYSSVAFSNDGVEGKIIASIAGKKDIEKLGRQMCEVSFDIQNSSFGTINGLEIEVTAENDRGRKVKNFGSAKIKNTQRFKSVAIAKGDVLRGAKGATFEEECKYLKTITINSQRVNDGSCNIRMMPEGIRCKDLVVFVNEGDDLAAALASKKADTGPKYLDVGYITLGGKKMSFLDFAAEDSISLRGADVELVGYVSRFSEQDKSKVWGYRFDVKAYAGEEGQSYAKMGAPYIDVIVIPSKRKNYGSDLVGALNNLRRDNFKMLTQSRSGKALVRFKGKANAFSNTLNLYVQSESVEILDKKS